MDLFGLIQLVGAVLMLIAGIGMLVRKPGPEQAGKNYKPAGIVFLLMGAVTGALFVARMSE